MNRAEVRELHYIAHLDTLRSILRHGILSHNRAERYGHVSIANPEVQERRKSKRVPGGRGLHDYANLYINARNAMLYDVLGFPSKPPTEHLSLCVLSVHTDVLDLPDVVISDRNAAADLSRFYSSPGGLQYLDRDLIFSRYWTDEDPIEEMRKREGMMAEVLVPDRLDVRYVQQGYVCCANAQLTVQAMSLGLAFSVNRYVFFNDGVRFHD